MALDAKKLADEITASVRAVSAAAPQSSAAAAAAAPVGDFCSIWPKAKPVLELVAGVVIFIPGAGATAGAVLQGLLKVGDQISAQVCK
jgi:hypothetical protein